MNKKELRSSFLSLRKSLTPPILTKEDLLSYPQFEKARVVFCYLSFAGEVKTHALIKELLKEKTVVVPYCTDSDGNMICVKMNSFSELSAGRFGILEPRCPKEFPKEEIDFAIVPAVAFDSSFFRLGYGKGYYDRFLSDISPYMLGVCQRSFFVRELPHSPYDVKMDSVLIKD